VAAFCADIDNHCTDLAAQCTTLHGLGSTAIANDCDATVAACIDVHQDCLAKAASCPLA
jgi:hypothetical protein